MNFFLWSFFPLQYSISILSLGDPSWATIKSPYLIVILSLLIAILFAIGNKLLLSLPLFFLAISALKIKGLGALQILYLFRLLNYLRSTGRYSYFNQTNQTSGSSNLSVDEAYQVLGLSKPCTKESVQKAHAALMLSLIHI